MSLKAMIKVGAESLGFVAVGFTNIDPVPGLNRYKNWVETGQHAGMHYLADERALAARADPRRLLPSCKTVISLLSTYAPPSQTLAIRPQEGRIAAYALQPDYHEVLKERLDRLSDLIRGFSEKTVETYTCVDSAPILEKGYAQKAGLGWIGRNSLLINPIYGSWVFLSELLINLDIEPNPPFERDGCEGCQLCIKACPTQAIGPDRTVDANRCLSYLTIENQGEIPERFQAALGKRVFGCDQCQTVCPANKNVNILEGQTPFIGEFVDLEEKFGLTAEEFKQKFQHTPVLRAKHAGFRRNIAIVMGNSGRKQFIPLLEKALEQESDLIVAESIRWALRQL